MDAPGFVAAACPIGTLPRGHQKWGTSTSREWLHEFLTGIISPMRDRLRGWLAIARGRCPRCGGHLKREVAVRESYTRTLILPRHGGRMREYSLTRDLRTYQITPVYRACPGKPGSSHQSACALPGGGGPNAEESLKAGSVEPGSLKDPGSRNSFLPPFYGPSRPHFPDVTSKQVLRPDRRFLNPNLQKPL